MRSQFTFLADPGHGWLLVRRTDLAAVGLSEADISPFSYQSGGMLGLEEDADAGTFLAAFKAKTGHETEIIGDFGSCPGWASFGARRRPAIAS